MFPKKGTCPSSAYKEPCFKPSFGMRWHLGERHCHIQEAATSPSWSQARVGKAAVFSGNCKCDRKSPLGKCSSQKKLMPNHKCTCQDRFLLPICLSSLPQPSYGRAKTVSMRRREEAEQEDVEGANLSSSSTAGLTCIDSPEQEEGRSLLFAELISHWTDGPGCSLEEMRYSVT